MAPINSVFKLVDTISYFYSSEGLSILLLINMSIFKSIYPIFIIVEFDLVSPELSVTSTETS